MYLGAQTKTDCVDYESLSRVMLAVKTFKTQVLLKIIT